MSEDGVSESWDEGQEPLVLPGWVPDGARTYLAHTESGRSIRAVARDVGCHASTILRQIRRIERRRDDLLVDEALRRLSESHLAYFHQGRNLKDAAVMNVPLRSAPPSPDDKTIDREARRVLRRLAEPGACLAVARDMEKAVVVRDTSDGQTVRTAVVDRPVAEAMALKEWISCDGQSRIMRYKITATGRAALKRMIAREDGARGGGADGASAYGDQHRDFDYRDVSEPGKGGTKRIRYNLAESPLIALSRRKDKNGLPFLADELVAAGERLREDFELAQMGPRIAQNWDRFLTGGSRGAFSADGGAKGPDAARSRVANALSDLGPGLGDVALRCCCFLEGMEAAEKRMGWSARSGKIVLRIALQRLRQHYDETEGGWSPLIG